VTKGITEGVLVKGEVFDVALPENLNLGAFFLDGNLDLGRGDKTAIYYKDRKYSFRDLWVLTNKVGNVLKTLGVEAENRVLLVLEDSPEWVAAWLATMKVGGVGTHAYTYLKPHDYADLLDLVRPKVVIVDSVTLARVREGAAGSRYPKALLVAGKTVPDLREGEFSLQELIASADERLDVEPTHRDDLAFWNFSGGTTGKPKGVPHMHRDGVIAYESFDHILSYGPDDVVLRVPKLFFHYSRDLGLLFPLRNGASVVLFDQRTTAELVFELIRKYRPTVLINVPTMMRAMIQAPESERADLSCVRHSMSSGELLSAQLNEEWVEAFGSEVINRFGSAESGIGYLCNRPGAVRPGSSGTVTPLSEIKLVDEDGLEVARGQPAVLLVRSDAAGLYYVNEHDKSRTTFLGDEWVNTGDVFVQDQDDYFWYQGRADDMVKVSGVWVSPLEIERTLQECSGVKECAALGIKDKDGLIKIKAFVVPTHGLKAGAKALADMHDELKRFCRERLAPHKIPRAVEFMEELPKTGQGKIDRRLLREQVL
jgi:benzoate-CoA ligase family protein